MGDLQLKGHNDEHCLSSCPLGSDYYCNPFPPNIPIEDGLSIIQEWDYPEKCDHPEALEQKAVINNAVKHASKTNESLLKCLRAKHKSEKIFKEFSLNSKQKDGLLAIVDRAIDLAGIIEISQQNVDGEDNGL